MDLNDIRVAVTVASLVLFVALVLHTWSRRRRNEHEAAAALPFADEAGSPLASAGQEGAAARAAAPTRRNA
ncbi:MAG: cbb3-type cytochrome c oxidase subunit 3 [Rubrivivax sp.]|nr:cbb3-type cytochrome c oxidase subunit 3 [Rubrivivax sp.]